MKTYAAYLSAFLLSLTLFACGDPPPPETFFDPQLVPAAPDYSRTTSWAARPDMRDEADQVPVDYLRDQQEEALVDVFFVHPTTFNDKELWNGDIRDHELREKTDESTIRHQATVFNGSCKVYAPRYRQLNYRGFFTEGEQRETGKGALKIAYRDVRAAFQYYLENDNQGRPFILASHSQGTLHAINLIKEFIQDKPLKNQLVAAYLVGWPIRPDAFTNVKPCENPTETGCFNTWCSFADGYIPDNYEAYKGAFSTNPITWTLEEKWSEKEDHDGGVLKNYNKIRSGALKARPHENILWVTKPDIPGKIFITFKNYHIADYNLYWLDIRNNVEQRVQAYMDVQARFRD